ncbi:MAG: prohead protease/major capsid protein fusion protein [Planctomycetota bacterium]
MVAPNSIALRPETFHARFAPESFDAEARTVEVVFSTGAEVTRYSWADGRFLETLGLDEGNVRLDRLNAGASVLDDHDRWTGLRAILGVVERAWLEKGVGKALIRFSEREAVAGIVGDVRAGIIRHISVGYRVHKFEDRTEKDGNVKRLHAIDWEPLEVSLVTIPADAGAGVRSARAVGEPYEAEIHRQDDMTRPTFGQGVGNGAATPSTPTEGADESRSGAIAAPPAAPPASPPASPPTPPPAAATPARSEEEIREEARAQERERVREIQEHGEALRLPAAAIRELTATGRQLSELATEVAAAYRAANPDDAGEIRSHVHVGTEDREKLRAAVTGVFHARMTPGMEIPEEAGEYRGRSLMDTVRMLATAEGQDGLRMTSEQVMARAFHTTGDFPFLLQEAGRRTLRSAYELAAPTWRAWCREGDLMDFRPHDRIRVGDAPALEEIPEGADVKFGTVGESKETIRLLSYGKGVGLDRRAMINDDLAAFGRLIGSQAQRVADLVSGLVITELTSGQVDGSGLFVAAKKNTSTGALSVASLGAAEEKMLDQVSEGGIPLALMPKYLLVPPALKVAAQQLTAEINPTQATEANPFRGVLDVVVEPRLTAASTTQWYLIADPARIDTIEVGWLEGNRGPQFGSKEVFENRGMKFAVWADVGVKAIDFRGLVRSSGA